MKPTIIFNELDRHKTYRHKVQGCERAIIVRSDQVTPFNLTVETMSNKDPHYRKNPFTVITQNGDYSLVNMPVECGMDLIFQIDESIEESAHMFVEIVYETCVPEKCCPCK